MSPASLAAFFTAAKPGIRGPLTGSMMQSESRALPVALAHPWRMPATCAWHSQSLSVAVLTLKHTRITQGLFPSAQSHLLLLLKDPTVFGLSKSTQHTAAVSRSAYQRAAHGAVVNGQGHGHLLGQHRAHLSRGRLKHRIHQHKPEIAWEAQLLDIQWIAASA